MPPSHIAILGGGLTGLSSAFHLSRRFPSASITLVEKEPRFGGWVRSERVRVKDKQGNVASFVLEAGPRTLRPNAKSVLELINLLDLKSSLVLTSKISPAAKYRYLHIPGTTGLQLIPSSFSSLFSSPLSRSLFLAVLREPSRKANRPAGLKDESVDGLLTRRFGTEIARTFGSAIGHGIYACDSRQLSIRAAFPTMWEAEERGGGSILRGFLKKKKEAAVEEADDYALGNVEEMMKDVSVFSFQDGIRMIPDALVRELKKNPKVNLESGVEVTSLRLNPLDKKFEITTDSQESINPTHVVSTLSPPVLNTLLSQSTQLPHLEANSSSSVAVVNLIFPPTPKPIHPDGFGYLIPRPPNGYKANGEGILGTVFDSAATSPQDTNADGFTKLTVMLGGPHHVTESTISTPTILKHLAKHLGHDGPLPEPLLVRKHAHRQCIPTLSVGHLDRMEELRTSLSGQPWDGRLEVVGAGVGGVSVGDCVSAGRRVGERWM